MKSLVFDTSSIISIVTNSLLNVLPELKQDFNGDFFIPEAVKKELVDRPLKTRKYGFEAMLVTKTIEDGNLKINKKRMQKNVFQLYNQMYMAKGKTIKIVHKAEIDALSLAIAIGADGYVVDERTMRLVIEDPEKLRFLLEKKLHTKITINKKIMRELLKITKNIKIIRSTELMVIAHERGLLKNYISDKYTTKEQIESLLWGLRLKGCSISTDEINKVVVSKNERS